ncbi:MAG TPA: putative metal-binding motif-containing protein, partial [Methanomicrobiales archaeon]|nr:putative metal-binding motif-containing protein [Methanomicrobiales archaeon]
MLAVLGIVLLLPMASGVETPAGIPDTDSDGVPDPWDICPVDTSLPEVTVPSEGLNTNRFALVDGDAVFDTRAPKGKGPGRIYSLDGSIGSSTCGCSCEQILAFSDGKKEGEFKFGCSIGIMDGFVRTRCEVDADGDGFRISDGDCDDSDPLRNPEATEECNGVDDDCDGLVPPDEADADGDGYRGCDGDCDDADPSIHPGATETCNGIDDDCDGQIDEGAALTYYLDADGDGYGGMETVQACGAPTGYVETPGDCDDANPSVYPGAVELCDGLDTNCDGKLSAGEADADGDGFRVCDGDCDDTNSAVHPGASEICDGLDNDCDGEVDEGVRLSFYRDADGDGYGSRETLQDCSAPTGYAAVSGDCDDLNPAIYPGAAEVCDGKDNDCDVIVDEGFDQDADRFTSCGGDCDDNDPEVYPG